MTNIDLEQSETSIKKAQMQSYETAVYLLNWNW